jgi:nucleoside-diphosphate-sugar epimerase
MLVTGAGGFVGGRIVEMAHLSGFANVRAGLRRWASAARVARFAVDLQLCDVLNPEQVYNNIKGVDTVVHCAVGGRDVIVEGTANTLDAAFRLGVKRFVHISTAEIYGNVAGEINEESPCTSMKNEYADAKIEAEKLCWKYQSKGLPIVILRPSIIYGPFGNQFVVSVAERLIRGGLGDMDDVANGFCNLVYVDDLVHSIFLSIKDSRAVGEAFNINGPDKITWNDYFKQLAISLRIHELKRLSKTESRIKSSALSIFKPAAVFVGGRYGNIILRTGSKLGLEKRIEKLRSFLRTTPSNFELALYSRRAYYSYEKAARILGYSPRFDLVTGIDLSVKWLAHEGHLERLSMNSMEWDKTEV